MKVLLVADEPPTTLETAVDCLIRVLDEHEREEITALLESDLIDLQFDLGIRIREDFGLWCGNHPLMESCKASNADDASVAIIRTLWARLRRGMH